MRFSTPFRKALTANVVALGVLISCTAFAQSVTTRLVVAGGSATSTKILPGGSAPVGVRLDIVGANIFGTGFTLTQLSPGTSSFISITGRSFVGSPFTDTTSGTSDATVLAAASALLDPTNDSNLGRTTVGLVGIAPASNLLAVDLTLTASAATPLGTYTVGPTAGASFATDEPGFNDYDMSGQIPFTIIVGQPLTVIKSGGETGTITADSGEINCGAICSDIYPGTVVTLTATPVGGSSYFAGWTGDHCSGTGTCVVTVDAAKTVVARFLHVDYGLTVTKNGTGTGTISSAPFGINCGVACFVFASQNTTFTLTATPSATSIFVGWSGGGCAGTGTCVVTVPVGTVNATFIDTDPSDTTIDSGPPDPSNQANPTFTFSSPAPGAIFRCSLDGRPFASCVSPHSVNVTNGLHTFAVFATDADGNADPTPAAYSWTVADVIDNVAPIPTLNEWMMVLLATFVGWFGAAALRRRG